MPPPIAGFLRTVVKLGPVLVALAVAPLPARAEPATDAVAKDSRPRFELSHQSDMGSTYFLRSAEYLLDGNRLFLREDNGGDLNVQPSVSLHAGELDRGTHVAKFSLVYEGHSRVFGYIDRYKFIMRGQVRFNAEPDYTFALRTKATISDNWMLSWDQRPQLTLEGLPHGAVVDFEVLPLSVQVEGETPNAIAELTPEQEKALEAKTQELIAAVLREADERHPLQSKPQQPVEAQAPEALDAKGLQSQVAKAQQPVEAKEQAPVEAQAQQPVEAKEQRPVQARAQPGVQVKAEPAAKPAKPRKACPAVVVQFATASAELGPGASAALKRAAGCARDDVELRVVVTGHADERGSDEYNEALGLRRAESVAHLLAQLGVASDRIDAGSKGESEPVCHEQTDACHARNRRAVVELRGDNKPPMLGQAH